MMNTFLPFGFELIEVVFEVINFLLLIYSIVNVIVIEISMHLYIVIFNGEKMCLIKIIKEINYTDNPSHIYYLFIIYALLVDKSARYRNDL